jgi:hypothetical protein
MFRENKNHLQGKLLTTVSHLPKSMKERLSNSWASVFYHQIFKKIDEKKFSVLYSAKKSRPNFPVNIWVGLEILKELFVWTDEELFNQFHFNLQTCYALGLEDLGKETLADRTLYYNRSRLVKYQGTTDRDLFKEVFEEITDEAIELLGIKTSFQRMDSSLIGSNIRKMTRLELLVKVLQNFWNDLPDKQRNRHFHLVKDYVEPKASGYCYHLNRSQVNEKLKSVGKLLAYFKRLYKDDAAITGRKSYSHIQRVLEDQFVVSEDLEEVEPKSPKEISADSLQNPADEEATFRTKGNKSQQGYVLNVTETADPDNPVQMLTGIDLRPNITSDEKMLRENVPKLKRRTGLNELVVDGTYSSEESEQVCDEEFVSLIYTGIRGSPLCSNRLGLSDFDLSDSEMPNCPEGHKPISIKKNSETGRHIFHYDKERCQKCPLLKECCVKERKQFYSLYCTDHQLRIARRRQLFEDEEYRAKQRLRPAVEGTISQFKRRTYKEKLMVRGSIRVKQTVVLTALAINFKRIAAVVQQYSSPLLSILASFVKNAVKVRFQYCFIL